jgi:lysyl-tRNA synthetase, class II
MLLVSQNHPIVYIKYTCYNLSLPSNLLEYNTKNYQVMSQNLSEQELIRREKLAQLNALGIDAFPAPLYPINTNSKKIKDLYKEEEKENWKGQVIAGRIMSVRDMGKACFAVLQDQFGKIQFYIKRDDICPGEDKTLYDTIWKKLIDNGDFIGIEGYIFTTKTGEISIHVTNFTILAKALKPLPIVKEADGESFDEVTDPEFRYRQRYADLVVNPGVKETFVKRTKLMNGIREYLNSLGALEVDTPVLQTIPGGAAARPFTTHHNALDVPMYMRIANELYLKRLIVGGFDFVYEFSRNFRNEGMDRTHNPEFTVLEFYVAYKDYNWLMDTTEIMLEKLANDVTGNCEIIVGQNKINMQAPYKRISILDSIKEHTGLDLEGNSEIEVREACKSIGIHADEKMGLGKMIDEIFSEKCEHHYIQPTFITDHPVEMSPLTKKHRTKAGLVERFELMINGKEIANAYSELNDPIEQRKRFEGQAQLQEKGDDEAMFIDHDFLRALEYGMPPTAGIGFGIDRLCMLLTNKHSIQDVLLFPMMRPENFGN